MDVPRLEIWWCLCINAPAVSLIDVPVPAQVHTSTRNRVRLWRKLPSQQSQCLRCYKAQERIVRLLWVVQPILLLTVLPDYFPHLVINGTMTPEFKYVR